MKKICFSVFSAIDLLRAGEYNEKNIWDTEEDCFMAYRYKTELHCHSKYVSSCSDVGAKEIVEQYLEFGYSTVVITDHLHEGTFQHWIPEAGLDERMEFFLNGYRKVKEYAKGRLNVLLGCEIRFPNTGGTDFLVYGADEDFFKNNPDMYRHERYWMGSLVHNNGCMFFQAHPFRFGMMLAADYVVDGIEVFNGHPTQKSHNRMAEEWMKEYPSFIGISGSDHHGLEQYPDAGILTEAPITSNAQLLEVLRSGAFVCIRDTDTMESCRQKILGT